MSTNGKFIPVDFTEIEDFEKFKKIKSVYNEIRLMHISFFKAFMITRSMKSLTSFVEFQESLTKYFWNSDENKKNYVSLLNSFSTHLYRVSYDEKVTLNYGFSLKRMDIGFKHSDSSGLIDTHDKLIDENLLFSAYRSYCSAKPKTSHRIYEFCDIYRTTLLKMSDSFDNRTMYIVYDEDNLIFMNKDEISNQNSFYDPKDVHYDLDENPIRNRKWDRSTFKRKYALKFKDSDQISWVSSSLLSYKFKLEEYNAKHKVNSRRNPFVFKEKRKYVVRKVHATRILNIGEYLKDKKLFHY
jgi:hypothetical protein